MGDRVSGRVGAVQQSNNRKPTFLPNCCSTTMISIRPCSTKTVFWWSMHSLYLLGNEMAWKDGLVDVTKKSQKPQHNNLPCFPPLLHSDPISCTAFLLQKVRGIREWQLGQGTNWIAYQKPVTIVVGHVAMSSGFVLGPTGASEEHAQGSKSLKAHSVQISEDHSCNPYQQESVRSALAYHILVKFDRMCIICTRFVQSSPA